MILNAALFLFIGFGLVVFLVYEIGISPKAAVFGTWKWRIVRNRPMDPELMKRLDAMLGIFDELDKNGTHLVDPDDLLAALLQSKDLKITPRIVKRLVHLADSPEDDESITRFEWETMIRKM